jgi:hypothetical protein
MLKRMVVNEVCKGITVSIAPHTLPARNARQDYKRNFLRNMSGNVRLSGSWPINISGVRNGYASNWTSPSPKVFTFTLSQ